MARFGEIVVEEGYATEEQVQTALTYQKTSEILLGKILVDMYKLTHADVERVNEHLKTPDGAGKRFGEVAVALGMCTDDDVRKGLEFQHSSKGVLGDVLIALGYITTHQRDEILTIQMQNAG